MPARVHHLAAIGLLIVMLILAGGAAMRESATVDEVAHVGAGLSYLQRLDLRLNPEHPPLAKIFAAFPLVLRGTRADYSSPAWKLSADFIPAYAAQWVFGDAVLGRWNEWKPVLLWARVPMLILTLLLGWIVYLYGSRFGGPEGGLLSLAVYITTPAILVFGPLVITDVPVTLFFVIALWQLGDLWAAPSARSARNFGFALGAALLAKFTGLLIVVTAFVLFLHTRFWPFAGEPRANPDRARWRKLRWRCFWRGMFWAGALVYIVYFIFSLNQPDDALNRLGSGSRAWIIRRPILPIWLYLRGLGLMLLTGSRPLFFFGRTYPHGMPFYFPAVFALKSTLGALLLWIMTAVAAMVCRHRRVSIIPEKLRPHWRTLTTGFFVFISVCLLSRLNISIRHFLVPIVLLTLMLAPLPRMIAALPRPRIARVAMLAAVTACFVAVLAAYPFFFPFANSLAFGAPIYSLLNDSNVSWNEALPEVARFAQEQHLQELPLDWASLSDPTLVVPQARPWNCQTPAASDAGQWVAVAAVSILENHNCGYLLRYPHRPLAGGSFYAFQLPALLPTAGLPGGPPLEGERKSMWGIPVDFRSWAMNVEHHPEQLAAEMQTLMKALQQGARPGK